MKALESQFTDELERSLRRLNESLAPYIRFVRAEEKRLKENLAHLTAIRQKMAALRAEIAEAT